MKYILIGMPGCGKTTLAKILAERNQIELCDTDTCLEKKYKIKIDDFFEVYGEQKFREFEHQIIDEVLKKDEFVVATGGGLPCFYNNMKILNEGGTTIYLKADPDVLYKRIINQNLQRPLMGGRTTDEIFDYLERTLASREIFYKKAEYTVDANQSIEEILKSEPFNL